MNALQALKAMAQSLLGGAERRATLVLFTGSSVGIVVSYLAQPILTRQYTPEAFGTADIFMAIVSLLFPISSLRYEDALLLPKDEGEAVSLFWLSVWLTVGATVLTAAVALAAAPWLVGTSYAPLIPWLPWLGVAVFLSRASRLMVQWSARCQTFGPIAHSNSNRAFFTAGWRVGAGWVSSGPAGLIHGFVAGHLAATAGLLWGTRGLSRPIRTLPSLSAMTAMARRYKRFALFTTPASLLNNLSSRLPLFVLGLFYTLETVGQFGRVMLLLPVPLGLATSALGGVFHVQVARIGKQGNLAEATTRTFVRLAAVGLLPTALICVTGPELFALFFGDTWREAGLMAQRTAPWLYLASIAAPLTALFDVLERHRMDFLVSLFLSGSLAAVLWLGGLTLPALDTLLLTGLIGGGVRALQIGLLLRLARVRLLKAAKLLFPYLFWTLLASTGAWAMLHVHVGLGLAVGLAACAGYVYSFIRPEPETQVENGSVRKGS